MAQRKGYCPLRTTNFNTQTCIRKIMNKAKIEMDIASLMGTWYVHYSNFPMWLKGNKREPTFTYSNYNSETRRFEDTVRYKTTTGNSKSIEGYDTVNNSSNTAFVWRGKGWLYIASSRWYIVEKADDLMVIRFDKTLFTPAGYDVICRRKVINPLDENNIVVWTKNQGISNMKKLMHT